MTSSEQAIDEFRRQPRSRTVWRLAVSVRFDRRDDVPGFVRGSALMSDGPLRPHQR